MLYLKHMRQEQNKEPLVISYDFPIWLQKEFSERCKRNPRYSLRAFANFLEIDASSLSQYMSQKRNPSSKMIKRLCDKLGTHPEQETALLNSLSVKPLKTRSISYEQIDLDKFYFISDWYHISILELTQITGFNPSPKAIAAQLSISVQEAKSAIERLQRLGLIKVKDSHFEKTDKSLSNFKPGLTSKAHRSYQKQVIKKALNAVDECKPEEKDITSISMAVDESKIPAARKLIEDFRKNICNFLEDGQQTRVFNMSVQLFPMSKKEL